LIVRPFFAFLTSLSMLHLMLVGGDLACASHGNHGGAVMAGMAMASAVHHASAGSMSGMPAVVLDVHGAVQSPLDCATPTQTRCCQAMSSCSVTTTVSSTEHLIASSVSSTGRPAHASRMLVSVLTTPEPPPPKA
jgi:hypothetical protein